MVVSPLGAGPMTVEEVLDTSWPSDLYSLLDADVPSGVSGPWTGPAAATPTPFSTPASPEGPGGLNPLAFEVFEVVPSGGPVPEPATPGLGAEVLLMPDQGETHGHLASLTDEVLTGFFSEFPSLPNLPRAATPFLTHPQVSPGLFSHSPGTQDPAQEQDQDTRTQYQAQDINPTQGHPNLGTIRGTRGPNQGPTPLGLSRRRGSYQQMKSKAQSLRWNIRDIKRRMWNRLSHHNTSHRASCPTHCVQALQFQQAELRLKIQRFSTTRQAMRLHEYGPAPSSGPLPSPWGSGPSANYSTPPPVYEVTVAPVAQVAPPSFPDLSADLMTLTLGPAHSPPAPLKPASGPPL